MPQLEDGEPQVSMLNLLPMQAALFLFTYELFLSVCICLSGLSGPDSTNWSSSTAPVRFTRQLNEAESNLLLACAADGGVRVWRNYLTKGEG